MNENTKLAACIAESGFSKPELAKRLNREIEAITGKLGKLTDREIRAMVQGKTRWPQLKTRLAFERVLHASAENLGFVPRRKSSAPPEDDVHRRTFLTATGGTALAVASPAGKRLGLSDVDRFQRDYVRILEDDWRVGGLREVEHQASELALRIQSALAVGTTSTGVRRRLHCLASDVTSSAAFAAIDAKAHRRARSYLDKAVTFAGLSGDSETQYHVWNHLAMTACQREDFSEGAAAADVMKTASIARRDPLYLSLAHMRNARSLAKMNQRSDTLRALSAAEQSFGRSGTEARPAWITFYDQSEVDGLAASVWFALGDFDRAEFFFHRTLAGIRPDMIRNRALYTSHLALSQAHQGELELACTTGTNAYEMLPKGSGSKRTTDMLGKIRKALVSSGSRIPEVSDWIERSRQWT
ncbi:XRE family transcriptional regulator [Streptomyces sp. NPDC023998]|uniref:XRE family transcriptional regulator n=1 Tax=Streptomyces sp. NPDC023998 TaxID=3154597 RepID=UPI0033F4DFD9